MPIYYYLSKNNLKREPKLRTDVGKPALQTVYEQKYGSKRRHSNYG